MFELMNILESLPFSLNKSAKTELYDFTAKTDFFKKSQIDKIVNDKRGWDLWFLLNFALWWKQYID